MSTTLKNIVDEAKCKNKNILIVGSPRSGTHVLGDNLSSMDNKLSNLGEICMVGYTKNPWNDIEKLEQQSNQVAHIVQLTPKITLASNIDRIKQCCIIVNIIRKDKLGQFASWIYSRYLDPTGLHGWHNFKNGGNKQIPKRSVEIDESTILQFKLEQLIDNYFLPDFVLCYENIQFDSVSYQKNEYSYPVEEIFENLSYVKEHLSGWQYSKEYNFE